MRPNVKLEKLPVPFIASAIFITATLCLSAAVFADVEIKGQTHTSGVGLNADGESVTYIDGMRMRTDSTMKGKRFSTILDVEAQKMISLNHQKKRAEVYDLRELAAELRAVTSEGIEVKLDPAGERKTIAGLDCERYNMEIKVSVEAEAGMAMDVVLSGPAWIAKDAPGRDDYKAFYFAAAEKGLFFGPPAAAESTPGQTRAQTEMYRKFAEAGMSCASDMEIAIEGEGPMAAIMKRVGKMSTSFELTGVEAGDVPDDLFTVPAGYKVKER